jgi:hypothetical protein
LTLEAGLTRLLGSKRDLCTLEVDRRIGRCGKPYVMDRTALNDERPYLKN